MTNAYEHLTRRGLLPKPVAAMLETINLADVEAADYRMVRDVAGLADGQDLINRMFASLLGHYRLLNPDCDPAAVPPVNEDDEATAIDTLTITHPVDDFPGDGVLSDDQLAALEAAGCDEATFRALPDGKRQPFLDAALQAASPPPPTELAPPPAPPKPAAKKAAPKRKAPARKGKAKA